MTTGSTTRSIISVTKVSTGKRYAEVVFDVVNASGGTKPCIGIGNFAPSPECSLVGITDGVCISAHTNGTARLHHDAEGASDGFSTNGPIIANGDVCNIALDTSSGKLFLGLNGVYYYDVAGTVTSGGDPAVGTNPTFTIAFSNVHVGAGTYRFFFVPDPGAKFSLRTQASQFTGSIPSGFSAWYP